MTISYLEHYEASIRFRRSETLVVRPECEEWDGREIEVQAGWPIGDDDARYPGEWAMMVQDPSYPSAWIASGDLVDLRHHPSLAPEGS